MAGLAEKSRPPGSYQPSQTVPSRNEISFIGRLPTLNSRENIFRREPPTCLRLPFNFHAVRGRPYTKENICRKPIQRAANNMRPALSNKSGNKAPRYRKTRAVVNLMNALDIDRLRETKRENSRMLDEVKNNFPGTLWCLLKRIFSSSKAIDRCARDHFQIM